MYKLSLLVFNKCMNNMEPAYLKELLISKKAPRTLRSAELILLGSPRVRTETFGKRAVEFMDLLELFASPHPMCSFPGLKAWDHSKFHSFAKKTKKLSFLVIIKLVINTSAQRDLF